MFNIMCRVSGGVTGSREALLKDGNGNVKYFEDKAIASLEALRLTQETNTIYSTATFSYWVVEEDSLAQDPNPAPYCPPRCVRQCLCHL